MRVDNPAGSRPVTGPAVNLPGFRILAMSQCAKPYPATIPSPELNLTCCRPSACPFGGIAAPRHSRVGAELRQAFSLKNRSKTASLDLRTYFLHLV